MAGLDSATGALVVAVGVASAVEMVEALTIVMAMGMTRGWRPTVAGIGSALVALTAFILVAGYALSTWLPEAALKVVIGPLLLIFGLQWLRKAIYRSAGRKAVHDEDAIYAAEVRAASEVGAVGAGLDWYAFVVSFKGVFLEGVEVVFIVITFGLNASNVPVAAITALVVGLIVFALGFVAKRPLSQVPENTLKYAVGLLLATFGTCWSLSGLGIFTHSRQSLEWPGNDLALVVVLACWFVMSRVLVTHLRAAMPPGSDSQARSGPSSTVGESR